MKLIVAIILFVQLQSIKSQNLIETSNGYFITGRGCGITNPIRYLNSMPKNIEDYECSFIELQNSRRPRTASDSTKVQKHSRHCKVDKEDSEKINVINILVICWQSWTIQNVFRIEIIRNKN